MHAADILRYGHGTIQQTVKGLPEADWNIPGACGFWSIREIIAHLASFEHVLVDILHWTLDKDAPTPTLQMFMKGGQQFNDSQVAQRKDKSVAETWAEYEETFKQSSGIFRNIPANKLTETGLLTFYGAEYDLEDFLVYTFYGHKREHGAQINAFRDILNQRKER